MFEVNRIIFLCMSLCSSRFNQKYYSQKYYSKLISILLNTICISSIDSYERKDDNNFKKALVCAIPDCQNKPIKQCPVCSNHFCYEHIKLHIHPSEFSSIQNEIKSYFLLA